MPKFDTSFNFGANALPRPKASGKKPGAGKKRRRGGTTSSKSRKHFGATYGS